MKKSKFMELSNEIENSSVKIFDEIHNLLHPVIKGKYPDECRHIWDHKDLLRQYYLIASKSQELIHEMNNFKIYIRNQNH